MHCFSRLAETENRLFQLKVSLFISVGQNVTLSGFQVQEKFFKYQSKKIKSVLKIAVITCCRAR